MAEPPALPHGDLEELLPDVFAVRGTYRASALISFSRTMVVLREGRSLTVVNSVRLSPEGEARLADLGDVTHVVRLGGYHGLDDPYYRRRFAPTYWSVNPRDTDARKLVRGEPGPIARGQAFVFDKAPRGEGALLVERPGGNLLVTCDSLQNWTDLRYCSPLGALTVKAMGFVRPAKIGPIWLKQATGGNPRAMWPDFERLLALDFRHLISGHGTILRDDAKQAVQRSCETTLGPR